MPKTEPFDEYTDEYDDWYDKFCRPLRKQSKSAWVLAALPLSWA